MTTWRILAMKQSRMKFRMYLRYFQYLHIPWLEDDNPDHHAQGASPKSVQRQEVCTLYMYVYSNFLSTIPAFVCVYFLGPLSEQVLSYHIIISPLKCDQKSPHLGWNGQTPEEELVETGQFPQLHQISLRDFTHQQIKSFSTLRTKGTCQKLLSGYCPDNHFAKKPLAERGGEAPPPP